MNELEALHRRIADLEAVALGRPLPPTEPRRPIRDALVALAAVLAGVLLAVFAVRATTSPKVVFVGHDPPPPELAGTMVLADDAAPWLVDVNGDGAKDLVVRGWHAGQDRALYAVAIDRVTGTVLWRSRAYDAPGVRRGKLAAAGDVIFLENGKGRVAALDARTGVELGARQLEGEGAKAMRVVANVLAIDMVPHGGRRIGQSHLEFLTFDRETNTFGLGSVLDDQRGHCSGDRTEVCAAAEWDRAKELGRIVPGAEYPSELEANGLRVVLMRTRVGGGPGELEHVIRFSEDEKPLWHTALAPPTRKWDPWPNTALPGLVGLGGDRLVYVYPTSSGEQRMVVRSLTDGSIRGDFALPDLGYGSFVSHVNVDADQVLVTANNAILVVDPATGALVRRIDTF